MKRLHTLLFLHLCLIFMVATGCAYTLKYTVKATLEPQENAVSAPKTFIIKNKLKRGKPGFSMETKLLGILSQSLLDLGWLSVREEEAAYTFTIDFNPLESKFYPEIGFSVFSGRGGGLFIGTIFDTGGGDAPCSIQITASAQGVERQYIWYAEIRAASGATSLLELAKHTIPGVLSRFPERGYWEHKDKVSSRTEPSHKNR